MSKAEFAASRGWSRPYVSKLARQGRLVLVDGRVDVEATLALLAETADPSKAGVAERHHRERAQKGVHAHVAPAASTSPLDLQLPTGSGAESFQKSRAHREYFLALLAQDEFLKGRRELVKRADVDRAAFTIARTLRDLLLGLPAQLAGELIAISDSWEMERKLTEALRRVLEDAANLIDLDDELGGPNPDSE